MAEENDVAFKSSRIVNPKFNLAQELKMVKKRKQEASNPSMNEHQARQDILARRLVHLQHGKTGHFSSSFNGVMYRDNSLWAASR